MHIYIYIYMYIYIMHTKAQPHTRCTWRTLWPYMHEHTTWKAHECFCQCVDADIYTTQFIRIYVYVFVHSYKAVYDDVHVCMWVCVYACINVKSYAYMWVVCMCLCVCMLVVVNKARMYSHIYRCAHKYTFKYISI